MQNFSKTRVLVYSAICVALSLAMSAVKLFSMPQGGTVTACSMLFIVLVGYWFGPKAGILAGVVRGLLDLALGAYIVHPVQLIMDYPLAFALLGVAGFVRERKAGLYIGYCLGTIGRWAASTLSGAIFFASYAPAGQNPFIYSGIYNASYIVPEMIITILILCIPALKRVIDNIKR